MINLKYCNIDFLKVKIFVSYSRRDAGDFAEQIRRHLTVFSVGDIWNDVIKDNITNCDIFVVIITHGSLVSPHVEKEVLQDQRDKKRIIPCVHKNVELRSVGYARNKWGLKKNSGD